MDRQKFIEEMFSQGVLVSKDILDSELDHATFDKIKIESDLLVLNSDYAKVITQQTSLVDWYEVDKYRVEAEKDRDDDLYQSQLQNFRQATLILNPSTLQNKPKTQEINSLEVELDVTSTLPINEPEIFTEKSVLGIIPEEDLSLPSLSIIYSFESKPHKYEIKDFTTIFLTRYRFLENVLRQRQELRNAISINRGLTKKEKEAISVIGLVNEISVTKTGHLFITLEDPTGTIKVLFSKNNKEMYALAKELVLDEVIGVSGQSGDKIIFAENIIWPDIPINEEIKKGEEDISVIFLSDLHVGSKVFLKEEFNKFLSWLKGEVGSSEQKEAAKKVKYIIIAGDLVDGVGIYPSQETELEIKDIILQYDAVTELLSQIPKEKQIIVCPGNHDMVHLAEPQRIFYKEYAPKLCQLPNLTIITNPGMINIAKTKTFSGFDILLYHGYSFDYYVASVESIRNGGGYHRADLIMKFLLKRRHLAPSFKSTPYLPSFNEDPLLIKKIPDFFVTGHIHYSKVANYKGITMISGSCWQDKTSFQEKMGHTPEPGRVPLINLKTREVKILKFI